MCSVFRTEGARQDSPGQRPGNARILLVVRTEGAMQDSPGQRSGNAWGSVFGLPHRKCKAEQPRATPWEYRQRPENVGNATLGTPGDSGLPRRTHNAGQPTTLPWKTEATLEPFCIAPS